LICAKEFFALQLAFAKKVAALSGRPFSDAVLDSTNLYIRFGLGRDFDARHPTWQDYIAGLQEADDSAEWTYRFYVARGGEPAGPAVVASVGCFSYARLDDDRIRLHFRNAESSGGSPLARDGAEARLTELAAIFAHVKRSSHERLRVVGASWLYNIAAYCRLFPPAYLATARVMPGRFRHMPLWGQFLDRHGRVKADMGRTFLQRLARASSASNLDACFPLPVLSLEAPVQDFYDFYRVSSGEVVIPVAATPGPAAARRSA